MVDGTRIRVGDTPVTPHSADLGDDGFTTPLRVAFVLHSLEPGGIERFVTTLCNHLPSERFAPSVICLSHAGDASSWIQRPDVPVYQLHKRPGNDVRIPFRLAKCFRRLSPHIVQSHNWGTLLETTLARKLANVPVHIHAERGTVLGRVDRQGIRMRIRAMVMRNALRSATAVISNAHSVAARVESACGFPSRRITVIPNGVPSPDLADRSAMRIAIRRQLRIPLDGPVLGSIGRLVPVKAFETAIRALPDLHQTHPDVHLVIVGDGPERSRLERAAAEHGVAGHVHLVGHHDQIHSWLTAMDVYLNTSRSEGMSQAILEAMAAGLPLVVTDVGDNARLVGGNKSNKCGLIVPAEDFRALARAIGSLVANPYNRSVLAKNSLQRHAQDYRRSRMIHRYVSFYRRLVRETTFGAGLSPGRPFPDVQQGG